MTTGRRRDQSRDLMAAMLAVYRESPTEWLASRDVLDKLKREQRVRRGTTMEAAGRACRMLADDGELETGRVGRWRLSAQGGARRLDERASPRYPRGS